MLLNSQDFLGELTEAISSCQSSLVLASAFIKTAAVIEVLKSLPDTVTVTVIARWQARDLIFQASDLSVYEFCREKGYAFGINPSFHGKLYVFDRKKILLGSANLTARGLGLTDAGNFEFGTKIEPRAGDIERLDDFFESEVRWMDDATYFRLKEYVDLVGSEALSYSGEIEWPEHILNAVRKPVKYLWAKELVFCTPQQLAFPNFDSDSVRHDFDLLGMGIDNFSEELIKAAFRRTRLYQWLMLVISSNPRANFGYLSSQLHEALLDDPAPYRKDVKYFVGILFDWMAYMPECFKVTQHKITRSVEMVGHE